MDHVTLRSPVDTLAAVPYLFGFQPVDSLVLLLFHGKQLAFQARVDLPPPRDADDLAKYVVEVLDRNRPVLADEPVSAAIIGYGSASDAGLAIYAVDRELGNRLIEVVAVLLVNEGRYWDLTVDGPVDRPREGVPFDISGTTVAAAATFEGRVAHPDRASLVATLDPVAGPGIEPEITAALERLGRLAGGQRGARTAARAAVRKAFRRYGDGGRLDDDEVAWLAVLLADATVRDETWARIVSGPLVPEHEKVWRDVTRRVPRRYVPAPATLLALVAWRSGDGVLADIAAERALAADRKYQLAGLLLQAVRSGLPPSAVDEEPPRRRRRQGPRVSEAA